MRIGGRTRFGGGFALRFRDDALRIVSSVTGLLILYLVFAGIFIPRSGAFPLQGESPRRCGKCLRHEAEVWPVRQRSRPPFCAGFRGEKDGSAEWFGRSGNSGWRAPAEVARLRCGQ